tara:strand:+ start:10033 stop:10848 length:816 start_codon:yes stop_codon:yes gene_type:complete
MFNGQTISLKEILWKVANSPHAEGLNYTDAAEYAVEALKLIGTPLTYIEKVTYPPLVIVNYKAALPDNIITIRGVKLLNAGGQEVAMTRATDLYHGSIPCNDTGPSLGTSSSTLPTSPYDNTNLGVNSDITTSSASSDTTGTEFTYNAQNGVIQTSVRDGEIELSYTALATDEAGFPLVPDNIQVKLCLEYYILFRFLEPLWTMGKVPDKVFHYIDQKKCFYMGASNTSMQLQGIDHLESVMNAVNRLIVNDKAFDNFYKGAGMKERIKRY